MAEDGTVKIGLSLDTTQADEQAKQVGNKYGKQITDAINQQAKSASSSAKQAIGDIGSQMEDYGKSYSKAVTLPILAAGGASIAAAVNIDTALTGVKKTVDGTAEQYEELKQKAIEFSQTNAVDPAQILDIQALGAQLGYAIDELDMFGEVVSGLDIATNMDAETAATQLAQFANIMGMSHDQTKNFGSTIVELGNNFATTEADISNMAMRIAGAGKQIGLSEADVLGLSTALTSMGISAEAGGTAISTVMSQIDKAVATNSESLETWASAANMSVDDFKRAWGQDAVGALSDVLVGMDAAVESGGNMAVMLDELGITSIRQTDTLKRLASNSEFLGKAVETANRAWEENTALDKEVENRNNSMAAQLEILKNKVTAVAVEVGEPLARALLAIIDAAQPLIDALASGAKAFADLDENGQKLVMTAVGIVAAFGPLSTVSGKLLKSISTMGDGWKRMSANIGAIRAGLTGYNDSLNKTVASQTKYKTIMIGGQEATVKYNAATKKMHVIQSATTNATKAQTLAMKANAVAIKASTVAMNAAKAAGTALKGVLATVAPVAILTAAVTAFQAISDAIQNSKEKAQAYREATEGLERAVNTVTTATKEEASAISEVGSSFEAVNVDDIIEQHGKLASNLREISTTANTSVALLDDYRGSIERLAGTALDSEEDVAELRLAVDGVNEACGTNYEVVQDAAGAYQIMADGAVVAKDAVLDLVDAQMVQIRAEAEREKYKALYSQLQADAEAYESATQNVTSAQDALNKKLSDLANQGMDRYWMDAQGKINDYALAEQQAVDAAMENQSALAEQMGVTQSSINRVTEQQKLSNMAMQEGAGEIVKYAESNLQLQAAVQGAGVDLVEFALNVQNAGISVQDLSTIMAQEGEAGITGFVDAYKAGGTELANWMLDHGYEIPENLAESIESGKPSSDAAAADVADGVESELESVDSGSIGSEKITDFANAIGDGSSKTEQAAEKNAKAAESKLNDLDSVSWGSHLIQNLASGMSGAISFVRNAANSVAGVIKSILGHSIPKAGILREGGEGEKRWGKHLIENIADGMDDADSTLARAAERAGETVRNSFGQVGISVSDDMVSSLNSATMGQLENSIKGSKGILELMAGLQGGGSVTEYNDNSVSVVIDQPLTTLSEAQRAIRKDRTFGLQGDRS